VARGFGLDPVPISARTGFGVDALQDAILRMLPSYSVAEIEVEDPSELKRIFERAHVREIVEGNGRIRVVVEGREEWLRALQARTSKT